VTDWKEGSGSSNGTYASIGFNVSLPIRKTTQFRIGVETFVRLEIEPSKEKPSPLKQENIVPE